MRKAILTFSAFRAADFLPRNYEKLQGIFFSFSSFPKSMLLVLEKYQFSLKMAYFIKVMEATPFHIL
jgi:hypothetical protein